MERKHRKHYEFQFFATIPEGRIVMKGSWLCLRRRNDLQDRLQGTLGAVQLQHHPLGHLRELVYEDKPLETRFTRHEQTTFAGPSLFG